MKRIPSCEFHEWYRGVEWFLSDRLGPLRHSLILIRLMFAPFLWILFGGVYAFIVHLIDNHGVGRKETMVSYLFKHKIIVSVEILLN